MSKRSSRPPKRRSKHRPQPPAATPADSDHILLPPFALDGPLGQTLQEKRIRISWEFTVRIQDIDPKAIRSHLEEVCRKHGQERAGQLVAEDVEAKAEMQRKILHSLLADPELLDRNLRHQIGELLVDDANDQLVAPSWEEVLEPAIRSLSPDEQECLQGAIDEDLLMENIGHLVRAIDISPSDMRIEELSNQPAA